MPAVVEADECSPPLSWVQLPPGPELGLELALVEWSALSDREQVAAMEAARRQVTWAQALLLDGVAELSRRRHAQDPFGGSDAHRRVCGEVSLELTVPTGQAEELVAMAETLPASLPCTWAALRSGQIDYDRARVMVDGVRGLDQHLVRRMDAELAAEAVEITKTVLRRRLTRAIRVADPDAYAERTKVARAERRVECWDNEDETCDLIGRNLDAVDAYAIRNRLTAAAQAMRADGDVRPIDQIRLDLFRDLLRGVPLPEATHDLITDEVDPTEVGERADLRPGRHPAAADALADAERQIARALAEIADEQLTGLFARARAAGRLDGLPLLIGHAAQAMRAALGPRVDAWCRATKGIGVNAVTDPASQDHGHDGYRPPIALQRLIQRRHGTCVFPTCHRRSVHCDIDHTVPYDKGGRTCRCNLSPLCRTHHRIFKQHCHWQLIQLFPGLLIWITPAGTWHIVVPQ
jgi:hypothetical protein